MVCYVVVVVVVVVVVYSGYPHSSCRMWSGKVHMLSLVVYFVFFFFTQDIEDQLFKAQRAQKRLEREAANQQKQDNKLQVGITLLRV